MSKMKMNGFFILSCLMILSFSSLSFSETGQTPRPLTGFPVPAIPQPQGFCGYCHILTYPSVIEKNYNTWKESKHNEVGCVECHYPPRTYEEKVPQKPVETKEDNIHIPPVPPGHFSYVELGGDTIKRMPTIVDASCTTAACHGKPEDTFKRKKIKFTEKVPFVHETHLLEKNQIEGMQVNCTTCHQHETDAKHFEVTQATCNLCHFANTKFNQGRARCELCHELPKKPIQTSGEKPITHEMLREAKVSCGSCHYELIEASGGGEYEAYFENGELKTTMVLGAGRIKNDNCLACHDQAKDLKESYNKRLMHQKHVSIKNARCLECHQPILHAKSDLNQPMRDQTVRNGCAACHSDPHRYQSLLAAGEEREGVPSLPDPMFKARTNCLGCHVEKELNQKGQTVMKASSKTCVRCHTKDYEQMFGLWKREVSGELERALRLEKEAVEAFDKHKPQLDQEKLNTAGAMLRTGRENLGIVRFGNGIHNAKYSIELLDSAMSNFKDTIAYLEGKDISEDFIQQE